MTMLCVLEQDESAQLDPDRLTELYVALGEGGAQDMICRAMEELAVRLIEIAEIGHDAHPRVLQQAVAVVVELADDVGLTSLARVARDVDYCLEVGAGPAVAATMARLHRVGERSLTTVWDMRDLSV